MLAGGRACRNTILNARTLILLRHGQSEFNAQNRFTGWADPPLTARGLEEAEAAAARLAEADLTIAHIFSSALLRARRTAQILQAALPGVHDFTEDAALNERDYGDLTGLSKADALERWGADQVRLWRRAYTERPPDGESLRETAGRVLSCYVRRILPLLMRREPVLVVAHGNSLRALLMTLDELDEKAIENLELATGEMRVYELGSDTRVESRRSLRV